MKSWKSPIPMECSSSKTLVRHTVPDTRAEWPAQSGTPAVSAFTPGKNLGAYGEAGAIITNDEVLAEKIRMFRDHGQAKKYFHHIIGWNARMDGIQGAVLSVKLRYLDGWNESRRKHAQHYSSLLSDIEAVMPPVESDTVNHVFHIYAIHVEKRDQMMNYLIEKGIHCGIHYPVPIHLQKAYASLGLGRGSFPVAEKSAREVLSLPMYPELTSDQIQYVVDEIKGFYG